MPVEGFYIGGYIFIPLVLFGVHRACVSMIWHCVGACVAVPVLHCVRLALCVVLSLGHILLTVAAACVNRV